MSFMRVINWLPHPSKPGFADLLIESANCIAGTSFALNLTFICTQPQAPILVSPRLDQKPCEDGQV